MGLDTGRMYLGYLGLYIGGQVVSVFSKSYSHSSKLVVAVPGFVQVGDGPYVFGLAEYLQRRDIDVVGIRTPFFQDLRESAEQVISYVSEIERDVEVALLGDSMGGLVVRRTLQNKRIRDRVRAAVCVSTPHYGTHVVEEIARKIPYGQEIVDRVPCLRQMKPGSDFLEELNQNTIGNTRVENLFGDEDSFVPVESARFRNNDQGIQVNNRRVVRGASHLTILFHPRLYRLVESCFED